MEETVPEFGTKRENEERRDGGCSVVLDPVAQRYAVGLREDGFVLLFSGGLEQGEEVEQGILRELREESGLHNFKHVEAVGKALAHYHNDAKGVNRVAHATCLLVVLEDPDALPVHLEAHEHFTLAWMTPAEIRERWSEWNGEQNLDHWFYFLDRAVARAVELGFDTTSASAE